MAKTELPIELPKLTRVIHALAVLAGIGACLGLGLCTLSLREKLPRFIAENQLSLQARMGLLKLLFACMFTVPVLAILGTAFRMNDADRLRTFERVASRLAPLSVVGLLPMLLFSSFWKDKPALFLAATLISILVAVGVLSSFDLGKAGQATARTLLRLWECLPQRLRDGAPVGILVSAICLVVWLANKNSGLAQQVPHRAATRELAAVIRAQGHAGFLVIAHLCKSPLYSSPAATKLINLALSGAAAFPLYLWSRDKLGKAGGLLLALCYLSYPALLVSLAPMPLPLGTGAVFFFLAAYAFEKRKFVLAVAASLLLLGIHEQTALWLVCFGIYLCARRQSGYVAAVIIAVSLAYLFGIALWVLPHFKVETYGKGLVTLWAGPQSGLLATLATLVANPSHALYRLSEQREVVFWLLFLVPMALIPLRGRLWLLWFAPFLWAAVVCTGRLPGTTLNVPGVAHLLVLGFAAQLLALEQIRAGENGTVQYRAALGAWLFVLVPCVNQFGCLWLAPP